MGSLLEDAPVRTATADYPELVVDWLPTYGPFVANGEWCDITDYVVSGSTQRGRQYELDQFQAGTLSLTLRSADRLFDPDNVTSPFYPFLVPMRQIRVSAVWNGTRYPVFRGYITDWGQSVAGADSMIETTIQAKDAFALLEQVELPSSFWALTVPEYSPTAWFRLNETDTTRMSDSTTSGYVGTYDNCQQGAESLVTGDSDGAAAFAHSLEERIVVYPAVLLTGYPFSFSALFKVSGTDPDGYKTLFWGGVQAAFSRPTYFKIVINDNATGGVGRIEVYATNGGVGRAVQSSIRVDDNNIHRLLVVCASGSSFKIYIDGVDRTGTVRVAGTHTWPSVVNYWTIGNTPDTATGDDGFGSNYTGDASQVERGTIDEVAIFNGITLDSDAAWNLANASVGWRGVDSGWRASILLDLLGWPSSLRNISTGIAILQGSTWSEGTSALNVLQTWASSELGAFFIDAAGKIVWRSRHYPLLNSRATTSQATFVDGHSTGTLKYVASNFEMKRDETLIRNPVEASRRNGVSVTVSSQVYVEKYGNRRWSAPATEEQDDAVVRDRAEWILARYRELKTRLGNMTILPRSDTDLWPQALGLELGDRITVERKPLGINFKIEVDQIIEGISHTFSPREWSTSYVGSPVDGNVNTYLILDDATYGELDAYRLAY